MMPRFNSLQEHVQRLRKVGFLLSRQAILFQNAIRTKLTRFIRNFRSAWLTRLREFFRILESFQSRMVVIAQNVRAVSYRGLPWMASELYRLLLAIPQHRKIQVAIFVAVWTWRTFRMEGGPEGVQFLELGILAQSDLVAHRGMTCFGHESGKNRFEVLGGVLYLLLASLLITHTVLLAYSCGHCSGPLAMTRGTEEAVRLIAMTASRITATAQTQKS